MRTKDLITALYMQGRKGRKLDVFIKFKNVLYEIKLVDRDIEHNVVIIRMGDAVKFGVA